MAIRNAAKAIILHQGNVLVNQCENSEYKVFYDLPGGGQHQFESMEDAVIREVLEETGYSVKIERFLGVVEEIYDDPAIREKYYEYSHRILHIFLVSLTEGIKRCAAEPDFQQKASLWLPLEEADSVIFHPTNLSGHLRELIESDAPRYLGCVRVP